MTQEYAKRFVTKDGNKRVTIYFDENADNPRYNTDEPLHCEDWSREFSIMTKSDRESKSDSARKLLEYLLRNYGDWKKMLGKLKANGKEDTHDMYDCCLRYDNSRKEWLLMMWYKPYQEKLGWWEQTSYDCKFEDIDIYDVLYEVSDETISDFAKDCFTDNIKLASYNFGYYGSISFDDEVSYDSDGICWLEKDEFMKYSGCNEDHWAGKTLTEIEWLTDEIEAWSNNDVYGFVVEQRIVSKIHKEYINVEKDAEDYEEEEWKETDSCWGFYGDLYKNEELEYILSEAGFKIEELEAA